MYERNIFSFNQVFVGRISELQLLKTTAESVSRDKGCVVTVTGDPGMGKSCLLEAFAREIRSDALVLEGRCPYIEGVPPYFPWTEIIGSYVEASGASKLETTMGEHAAVIGEAVPAVRKALGKAEKPVPLEEPGSARFRFFRSVSTVLKEEAKKRNLIVILHDLHWMDTSSSAFLRYILGELAEVPLFLILSYRDRQVDDNHPLRQALAELARVPRHDSIVLKGFTELEVREFLTLSTSKEVSQEVAGLVFRSTEGVPLFVRELAQSLHRDGSLIAESKDGALISGVPATIRDMINGWLEQLSPRGSETVTAAAVIGMDFTVDLLAACCQKTPEEVMLFLEEAVALSLLDRGNPADFVFLILL